MAASWTKNRKFWNLILEAGCEAQTEKRNCSEIHQEAHDIMKIFEQEKGDSSLPRRRLD